MTDGELSRLRAALDELAARVEGVRFALPGPHRDDRNDLVAELGWLVTEYLLPRIDALDAPATVVLVGSTGAGKSTVLNSLAQESVSRPGAVRPTTRAPVVWVHADESARYGREVLPSWTGADRSLEVVTHGHDELRGVAVVDTPDLDSVEAHHRRIAEELLAAADLCVFVTSAQRYADAVPWQVLKDVGDRGLPLLVVLNRLPARGADDIVADLRSRLVAAGIGSAEHLEVLRVAEQEPAGPGGALDPGALAGLRSALERLADPTERAVLVAAAVGAGTAHAVRLGGVLVDELDAERADIEALRGTVAVAYADEMEELSASLEEGRLIHSEVLARWQEFVGTGELLKALGEGVGRVRGWLRQVLGGRERVEVVEAEARGTLAATVASRADRAAASAASAWDLSPAGAALLDPTLWRADPATPDRARRAVEDWLADLARLVAEQGEGRWRTARIASAGVNAVAVALMVAVFAQTGGLTGAEIGISTGALAVQQRLLEHVFGSAAARALVSEGRRRLRTALMEVLGEDRRRFDGRLVPVTPPDGATDAVAAAVARLRDELDALGRAGP